MPDAPTETLRRVLRPLLPVFLAQALLVVAWSLATPLDAAPDEHQHVVRAAAVARGEVVGDESPVGGGARVVDVPRVFERYTHLADCFMFDSGQAADCSPGLGGPGGDVATNTNAGLAPPAYYVAPGLPLVVAPNAVGVHLGRILSGLVAVAFLTAALGLAARARPRSLLLAGIVVAWTPMAQFLAGVVNPSSLEIGSGVLLWTAGAIVADPARGPDAIDDDLRRHATVATAVAGAAFVLSRQLSPLWLAVIGVALLASSNGERLREVARDRLARRGFAALVVAGLLAVAWLVVYRPLASPADQTTALAGLGRADALATSLGRLGYVYRTGIGVFGWLDTLLPSGVELVWTGLLFLVLAVGAIGADRRRRLVLLGLGAVVVLLPALIESTQLDTAGATWQGRYTLPIAMGLPILAGLFASEERARAITRFVVVVAGAASFVAFYVALRRYAVGTNGPVWFVGRSVWDAPLPMSVVVLLGLAGVVLTARAALGLSRSAPTPVPPD